MRLTPRLRALTLVVLVVGFAAIFFGVPVVGSVGTLALVLLFVQVARIAARVRVR